MKYWLCYEFHKEKSKGKRSQEIAYPFLGALFVGKEDQEPPKVHDDDKWIEISQKQYENCMEDPTFVIRYDGLHCIGNCLECKRYIAKKKICEEDDHKVKNPKEYKNCCVYNSMSDFDE